MINGRILHLIHEQVLNTVIEGQCNIARLIDIAERLAGGDGHLNVICYATFAEQSAQLCHCQWQQIEQGQQDLPLPVAVSRRRQSPHALQVVLQTANLAQRLYEFEKLFFLAIVAGGKTVILVYTFAPRTALNQKNVGNSLPGAAFRCGKGR